MARYTNTIQDILMMYVWEDGKDEEITTTKEIINYAMPKLFDFPYPLYDEKLKEQFQRDFIRHFYTREIGSETIALFKQRLEDYLYLSHEKWAKVYETFNELNPFINYDVKTTRGINENESTDNTSNRKDIETNNRVTDSTENVTKNETTNTTSDSNENMTSNQTQNSTSKTTDFTRSIDSNNPDERLNLTANDGQGLLQYASSINETRGTSDTTNNTTTNATRDTTNHETSNTTKATTQGTTAHETSDNDRNLTRDETEKILRELSQAIDERKTGKIGNNTYTSMYYEFINKFEGIHKQMFREMSYLFLSLLN